MNLLDTCEIKVVVRVIPSDMFTFAVSASTHIPQMGDIFSAISPIGGKYERTSVNSLFIASIYYLVCSKSLPVRISHLLAEIRPENVRRIQHLAKSAQQLI